MRDITPKKLKIVIAALATVSLAACASLPVPSWLASQSPKLYVMDCGYLSFPDVSPFGISNKDTPVREMFVPCYLISHKGKTMLWDAGLPVALVGQGDVPMEGAPGASMRYDRSVVDQLADIGLKPSDVDYLALSHLHFDHAGAANLFADSTWLVQRAEHAAGFAEKINPVFNRALYAKLENAETKLLDGDHDVFGDGKVQIISTPGHTPGHQILYLEMAETGRLVLSGDLYHFRVSKAKKATPVFNTSRAETLRSMGKAEALLERTGATLWIEHDMKLARTLKKAPDFYQ